MDEKHEYTQAKKICLIITNRLFSVKIFRREYFAAFEIFFVYRSCLDVFTCGLPANPQRSSTGLFGSRDRKLSASARPALCNRCEWRPHRQLDLQFFAPC